MEGRAQGWPLRMGRFLQDAGDLLMVSDGRLALRLEPADEVASARLDDTPNLHWSGASTLGGPRLVLGFRPAQGAPLRVRKLEARARPALFEGRHRPPSLLEAPLFDLQEPVEGRLCSFEFSGRGGALA